jgi:hypothetical protein
MQISLNECLLVSSVQLAIKALTFKCLAEGEDMFRWGL